MGHTRAAMLSIMTPPPKKSERSVIPRTASLSPSPSMPLLEPPGMVWYGTNPDCKMNKPGPTALGDTSTGNSSDLEDQTTFLQ